MERRWVKRPGNPRRADVLPRGMMLGPVMNTPWQGDAVSGLGTLTKGAYGGGMGNFPFVATPWGMGARLHWTEHHYAALDLPGFTPLSIECLYLPLGGLTAGKNLLSWRNRIGSQAANLVVNGDGRLEWSFWNGASRVITGSTVLSEARPYHIVITNDRIIGNETTRIYVDGALDATATFAGNMEDIPHPNLRVGSAGTDNTAVILMVTASRAAWTQEEVIARRRDPYSHLVWPEDDEVIAAGSVVVDASSVGATLVAAAAFIAGAATVQIDASAGGSTIPATVAAIPGDSDLSHAAAGSSVTASTTAIAGGTALDQSSAGSSVTAAAAAIPGAISLAQSVAGAMVVAVAQVTVGGATVDAPAVGTTISVAASSLTGTAEVIAGNADASAGGAVVGANAVTVGGAASVHVEASGAVAAAGAVPSAGAVTVGQAAPGVTATAWATGLAGSVIVSQSVGGATVEAVALVAPGAAVLGADVAGAALAVTALSIDGGTALDQAAAGALVAALSVPIGGIATTPSRPVPPSRIVALPARERSVWLIPRARIIALPTRPPNVTTPPERNS